MGREFQSRERGSFAALLLSLLGKSKGSVLCSARDLRSAICEVLGCAGSGTLGGKATSSALRLRPLRAGGELASSLPGAKEKDCAIYIFLENPFRRG